MVQRRVGGFDDRVHMVQHRGIGGAADTYRHFDVFSVRFEFMRFNGSPDTLSDNGGSAFVGLNEAHGEFLSPVAPHEIDFTDAFF